MVHQRRAKEQAGVNVTFTEDMNLTMKKANFLANSANKQQFIKMLGHHLEKKCKVYHASGDADLLIVQKAVRSTSLMDTALVGEDTDLLICCVTMLAWILITFSSGQSQRRQQRNPKCGISRMSISN